MEQLVPWLILCTAAAIFCLVRPNAARLFTGVFFFLVVITPLGVWTLPNPVLAAGLTWLLTKDYPISTLEGLRSRRRALKSTAGSRQMPMSQR